VYRHAAVVGEHAVEVLDDQVGLFLLVGGGCCVLLGVAEGGVMNRPEGMCEGATEGFLFVGAAAIRAH
jgi:hypothetical protein